MILVRLDKFSNHELLQYVSYNVQFLGNSLRTRLLVRQLSNIVEQLNANANK